MSEWGRASFPGVMVTVWTMNLSLHRANSGGSSSIAWSVTDSPPRNVNSLVEIGGVIRRGTRLTLKVDTLTRRYPARIWLHAVSLRTGRTSISTLEPGTKKPGTETDPGSRSLNPECHRLGIVVRNCEIASCVLSKRP